MRLLTAVWIAALLSAPRPAEAKANVSKLADECDSRHKQKACRELAKAAERDKDTSVRIEAIGRLSDEAVLSRIAEHDVFPAVRDAATARLKAVRAAKGR